MQEANILVPIAMFGCVLAFLIFFATMPPRRAVLVSFLGAWLFLPIATYQIEGIPDYTKLFATCFGILIAVVIFDFRRLLSFRPKWVDIPMIIWCLVPIASSLSNDVPVDRFYDGLSESFAQCILWGVPYFLGRLYFTNWKDLRELAIALLVSAAIYIPFLLFEMKMSPQLHKLVYGYHQHKFDQTLRFGAWRPMVFMQHGLMVSFWMMSCSLVSTWMWWSGSIKKISRSWLPIDIPGWAVAAVFTIMTVLCVSVNAWLWLGIGLLALFLTTKLRTPWIVITMIAVIPVYLILQGVSIWPTDLTVDFATGLFGPDRAQSLEFRYFNEELLTEKAREQPFFGWAGWGRQLVRQQWGPTTVPDSFWVIVFGKFGAVGLVSLMMCILLPTITFIKRYPPWIWAHPNIAPAAAMSMILVVYMYDFLLNAMINPLFMLTAGGLLGTYVNLPQLSAQMRPPKSLIPLQKETSPAVPAGD